MRRAFGIAIVFLACGPKPEPSTPGGTIEETCRTTLTPRPRSTAPPSVAPPPPVTSRIVAHVDMKLAPLAAELEKSVPRRVVEDRGRDIGVAGSLDVTVDRGPFTTSVEGENLLVRTELRGHAEACAKGRCYASCDPIGVATAAIPLRLTTEYRFAPSRVTVAFTRGCHIKALGGFLTVDVTPNIQQEMTPALRQVEKQIDARVPQPRPQVERLWKELNAPRALPLGACAVVNPRGLVQGPMQGAPGSVRMRFALAALPELRTRCGDPPPAVPLPPLAHDRRMPEEDDLVVAFVWPLAKAAASIAPSGDPFVFEGARVRATNATALAVGADVELALALRGEACGDATLRAMPAWSDDANATRAIVIGPGGPRIPPPVQPEGLKTMIPEVASSMSDPSVDTKATVQDAKPLASYARGEDLVATVRVRGKVEIAPH